MTYPFGATKTDLEKAFRLKAASKPETNEQKLEPLQLSESELATILFEHPILGSLADYPNGRRAQRPPGPNGSKEGGLLRPREERCPSLATAINH
jgi:hypothetical protein